MGRAANRYQTGVWTGSCNRYCTALSPPTGRNVYGGRGSLRRRPVGPAATYGVSLAAAATSPVNTNTKSSRRSTTTTHATNGPSRSLCGHVFTASVVVPPPVRQCPAALAGTIRSPLQALVPHLRNFEKSFSAFDTPPSLSCSLLRSRPVRTQGGIGRRRAPSGVFDVDEGVPPWPAMTRTAETATAAAPAEEAVWSRR
jgi:hypothetical protein